MAAGKAFGFRRWLAAVLLLAGPAQAQYSPEVPWTIQRKNAVRSTVRDYDARLQALYRRKLCDWQEDFLSGRDELLRATGERMARLATAIRDKRDVSWDAVGRDPVFRKEAADAVGQLLLPKAVRAELSEWARQVEGETRLEMVRCLKQIIAHDLGLKFDEQLRGKVQQAVRAIPVEELVADEVSQKQLVEAIQAGLPGVILTDEQKASISAAAGELARRGVKWAAVAELQASSERFEAENTALKKKEGELQARAERLAVENRRLGSRLALERAIPKGSLGDFFLAYERFAEGLRFEAELRIEYRVHWKLDEDVPGHSGATTTVAGKASKAQGVLLGRRSNFVFGLVMVPDLSPALYCPTASDAFRPPSKKTLAKRWYWMDKTAEYVLAEQPISRVLHVRALAYGSKRPAPAAPARVVQAWREADKGFSVLVVGVRVDDEGVDPGPPYVSERGWMALTEKPGVFPMTAPNGGIVLHKEHLGEAYRRDKENNPAVNSAWDYYRDGWLRPDWDGTQGRIEVLFAPLPEGKPEEIAPQVHSLIFPMIERQSFWLPFWSLRERLLAPSDLDLSVLPALNVASRRFDFRMQGLPMESAGEWDPKAFSTALYDLLKRRPVAP